MYYIAVQTGDPKKAAVPEYQQEYTINKTERSDEVS
jgi:hypothetical protein